MYPYNPPHHPLFRGLKDEMFFSLCPASYTEGDIVNTDGCRWCEESTETVPVACGGGCDAEPLSSTLTATCINLLTVALSMESVVCADWSST